VADAHVTRVKANGFTALVGRYGVEAIVHLSPPRARAHRAQRDVTPPTWQYDAERHTLTRNESETASGVCVRVFDRVRVVVLVDDSRPHDVRYARSRLFRCHAIDVRLRNTG
jgi:exoribonuclease R